MPFRIKRQSLLAWFIIAASRQKNPCKLNKYACPKSTKSFDLVWERFRLFTEIATIPRGQNRTRGKSGQKSAFVSHMHQSLSASFDLTRGKVRFSKKLAARHGFEP
jgi:hypothetical protein